MNGLMQFVEVLLLGIFIIKKWVKFSLTSFSTLNYDCVMKTLEMFNSLPLINNLLLLDLVFIINHISNHIVKNYEYFMFFTYILFNIFINILHII